MRSSSRARFRQAGFTFLWTLLAVALMGLSLALAVDWVSMTVQRSRERQLIAIGHEFRLAIMHYYDAQLVGGRHVYPTALEELLQDPRVPGIRRHLRKIYLDPMTGKAEWGLLRVDGRIVGVYSLSGVGSIKRDGFEPDESGFAGKQLIADWVFTYPADLLQRISVPK